MYETVEMTKNLLGSKIHLTFKICQRTLSKRFIVSLIESNSLFRVFNKISLKIIKTLTKHLIF